MKKKTRKRLTSVVSWIARLIAGAYISTNMKTLHNLFETVRNYLFGRW